ncbi:MAG: hypothetical protein F4187_10160 [Gemmatimonadetes bacterium]|nr:hypothetical protein [Gemmatimonadota bacterium]MYK33156.1 hypothetical protein [Boseongicola sp. SB0670_bin_30]
MKRPVPIPRPVVLGAALAAALLAGIGFAASRGLVLGNATMSVPRGLYLRAVPDEATYITFCLGERHRSAAWYRRFCSPDNLGGLRILKRIREAREGHVIVEGDGPRALDSRILGPVRADEIRGWWIPVVQVGATGHGG